MEENNLYKERMLIEFEELVTRIARLNKFVEGAKPNEDTELLMRQLEVMEEYKRILGQRLLKEMNRY